MLISAVEGVMSGIISAEPFMNYFPETYHNSTWQGFVTAIYEIGCKYFNIQTAPETRTDFVHLS